SWRGAREATRVPPGLGGVACPVPAAGTRSRSRRGGRGGPAVPANAGEATSRASIDFLQSASWHRARTALEIDTAARSLTAFAAGQIRTALRLHPRTPVMSRGVV